jgi:hypothetical protein
MDVPGDIPELFVNISFDWSKEGGSEAVSATAVLRENFREILNLCKYPGPSFVTVKFETLAMLFWP